MLRGLARAVALKAIIAFQFDRKVRRNASPEENGTQRSARTRPPKDKPGRCSGPVAGYAVLRIAGIGPGSLRTRHSSEPSLSSAKGGCSTPSQRGLLWLTPNEHLKFPKMKRRSPSPSGARANCPALGRPPYGLSFATAAWKPCASRASGARWLAMQASPDCSHRPPNRGSRAAVAGLERTPAQR